MFQEVTAPSKAVPADTTACQHTVAGEVTITGQGLFLGQESTITICPAPANHGIVFECLNHNPPVRIPAHVSYVTPAARRTTLKSGTAVIETVEHCMSALAGLHIDNALIRVKGAELPCGDGSAAPFVDPILDVGVIPQDQPRKYLTVTEPIMVQDGDVMIAAFPNRRNEKGFHLVFDLDYGANSHRIKRQTQAFTFQNGAYVSEVARARTYSLSEEAMALRDLGLCQHLSPRDMLVIGDEGPIENTYRFDNEPVRHKIVDMLGDLYLVGGPIHGRFVAYKSGHALNRMMAMKILEQNAALQRRALVANGQELDIRDIQRVMPHRYPMLLVDRVVSIQGDTKAIGIKNVSINEPFFQGHYPGTPIMPGVLIVEAMAQLGGLLMSQRLEHTGKIAMLLSVDRVRFRKPVTPGDQLVLEAQAIQAGSRTGTLRCEAFVGAALAAEAQIRFMMVDAAQT